MPIMIDSNVLVYMFDGNDETRRKRAVEVVVALGDSGQGRLSAQCLAEFFRGTTSAKRGRTPFLSVSVAAQRTEELTGAFEIFPVTYQIVTEALRGVLQHQLPFWDAQIWASSRLNQITVIFSEDAHASEVIDGVRFVNPFADNFRLQDWIE
jgi:predicted nucleic acid-binding protein